MAQRARPARVLTAALLAGVLPGCAPAGRSCPQWVRRAVEVVVVDARTGRPAAAGAGGTVTDGGYVDSLRLVGWTGDTATTLGAASGRPGTYAMRVERAGYAPYTRTGVRARDGVCGVVPARVVARLAPAQ